MGKVKSKVWLFFNKTKDGGICKNCSQTKTCKGGNTSNLVAHLRFMHPGIYNELNKMNTSNNSDSTDEMIQEESNQTTETLSTSTSLVCPVLQPAQQSMSSDVIKKPKIQSTIRVIRPLDRQTEEKYKNSIARWVCMDMQPYRSVEKPGFKQLMNTLCPNFKIPSRKYFSDHKIPKMYDEIRLIIQTKLSSVQFIALTTDCWTSNNGHPFIGLTAHTISNEWKLETFCLACTSLDVDHTAQNLQRSIKDILFEWKIDSEKITAITTDCGANIIKAVGLMNFNHVACFGHALNTGVTRAFNIQPVKMCITNATRIRSIFHYSNKMKRSLLEAQNQLKLPTLVAPSSSETRWWSVLPCLYFVKTQYSALLQIFTIPKHYNLLPTRNQMKLINRLLKVIEPLKLLGESMASEKNITISDLWPIYQKLKLMYKPLNQRNDVDYNNLSDNEYSVPLFENTDDNDYTEIFTQPSNIDDSGGEDDEEETSETNSLSQALKHVEQLVVSEIFETLSKRYSSNEKTMKLLKKASFLDPRHRNKYLGNQNQIGVIHDEIKLEMEQISNNISANDHSLKKTHHYTGIAAFLDNPTSLSVENEVSTTESEAESINREILGYLQMPLVNLSTNSTDWWGKFGAEFPKLETLAKKYLCIPGTSVPCERLFSTGGNICTDNRASLTPGHAEQLIFLSKNSQFF